MANLGLIELGGHLDVLFRNSLISDQRGDLICERVCIISQYVEGLVCEPGGQISQ